ncbi:amino acid ABC transporter permease [Pectobacteriaceae bacterium CE70]|uniref:Amino acid ABC transporter permease n=1 Tax=Serratia sp. (strain ATCC 39006) TaxID=104623 RepID=A0A2I5TPE8_SERS3|nr:MULTISPECIES: amino acid ABC transporter permease [Enterobacterales]WJV58994.1 amino acid ABC transporter permease [Pectobacteriaceae bacterium C111]WJV67645.1 amino acid ABC transporter permease [Pectobacteriaceae bacterium CE70]WJY11587.1 amino acid ABC transporter permease [Pectobacteriaceae bacterium C80]WJY14360.1 amino acid ABC transporter permease [Pectobacteriaceae bacterium CE90]AUH02118.1 amino acid ABC transporter permease [Serratia sp. ATCC 39006]
MNDPFSWWYQLWQAKTTLAQGFMVTVLSSGLAIIGGTVMGTLIGVVITFGHRLLRLLLRLYIDVIRGTPVLVLVLACFYIAPAVGWNIGAFEAGVLALTLFCSSHVAEIVRGALQAVPKGQSEAAKAIALTFYQDLWYVQLPQALRQILPTWVNSAAEIVKASTLLSVIGVADLLLSSQQIIARTFMTLPFYAFAGLLFFIINFSIECLGRYLEKRVRLP